MLKIGQIRLPRVPLGELTTLPDPLFGWGGVSPVPTSLRRLRRLV